MTTATIPNHQPPRKQLSDQLDRLDSILDALSEGLNGAVADAAREGTRQAVKDAIIEIMTDPTLRARLHEAAAPEPAPTPAVPSVPPQQPGFWARLKAQGGQAAAAVGRSAGRLVAGAVRTVRVATDPVGEGVRALQSLGSLKNLALLGLGIGVAVGAASFLVPHTVAAALSGISGAVAATAVQLSLWMRRVVRALALA